MKRKFTIIVCVLLCALLSVAALVGCTDDGTEGDGTHEHNYATTWSSDGESHWHACLNSGCDAPEADKAAHTDSDGDRTCDVCGAKIASTGLEIYVDEDYDIVAVTGRGECTDTDIVIPSTYNGMTVNQIGIIEDYDYLPFENDSELTSVTIPSTIETIANAFNYCENLTEVTIPGSVEVIDYSFNYCGISDLTIESGLESMAQSFGFLNSLTSVVIPDSVTEIGDGCFDSCSALTDVTLSENLAVVGRRVFQGCYDLAAGTTAYTIYENGCYLGSASNPYMLLAGVESISQASGTIVSQGSFTAHDDTEIIGSYAFDDCRYYDVHLGTNLRYFATRAFHPDGLYIHYPGTIAEWNAIDKDIEYIYMTTTAKTYNIMCIDGSPEHD